MNRFLREELIDILSELPPTPVVVVGITGEKFSPGALRLARVYDKAKNGQRTALNQIADSFEKDSPP